MVTDADSPAVRVFIGYDPREAAAFDVLTFSIRARASSPVSITALKLAELGDLMWRERHELQSTDFSFSRFLVPYLCGFEGWVVFMDCDMLVLDDIAGLWSLRDERYAVQVVQHDHRPQETTKFFDQPQTTYEKKNWSNVMLLNCGRCTALTPEYVNLASGLELHRFQWLEGEDLIGKLPRRWNHLVDYDQPLPPEELSNLHFTNGGPYFDEYRNCGYADLWFAERDRMVGAGRTKSRHGGENS